MSKNLLDNLETKKENSDKKKSDQANYRNTLKQKLNSLLPKAHSLEVQIESKKSAITAFCSPYL